MSALSLQGAQASIGGRRVLDAVSLDVAPGQVTALCGPNGAGKTSVIRALAGVLPLSQGSALIARRAVVEMTPRQRAAHAAWLPQERRIAWNMPAVEVAALGAPFLSGQAARRRALEALDEIEAGHLADRGVAEMSGGERARVLFARFLATDAGALMADEPAAGLDPDAQILVMQILRRRAAAGHAVLVSLHDLNLAARWADRVVVMKNGAVAADGPPTRALSPERLDAVFGVSGVWLEGPSGPVLSLDRRAGP